MAPEMLDQKGAYNEKIDVWAAGVILFELINGNGIRLI
jgi:serine/threonine protein kinase